MTHVIAIDGPSGSGKSSTSRGVASTLGYAYLDTGAMYRAMTWAMLQRGVDVHDAEAVASASAEVVLASGTDPQHPTIEADGVDVSEPIRGDEVTGAVSPVATVPEVRRQLVDLQRKLIAEAVGGIVVEGRDIGTVVAPDASLKVYLVADPVARARRRALELGVEDAEAMREALARRDAIDSNRKTAPLAQAEDAIVVDGTDMTLDEVIDRIVALAQR
ncbi:(d)CMP kinase [Aeromicrobium sp.]|uniref:(d)CMP kinase n=1 Tax=Aeromicrobium sp. TaxID=1871063 RepID=UPI0028A7B639|nr:(d)CMP kinase [Aeromicrobium sp.]